MAENDIRVLKESHENTEGENFGLNNQIEKITVYESNNHNSGEAIIGIAGDSTDISENSTDILGESSDDGSHVLEDGTGTNIQGDRTDILGNRDNVLGDSTDIPEDSNNFPEWLQDLESPFNWLQVRFPNVTSAVVIDKLTSKTEMDEGLNDSFPYEKFISLLTFIFELSSQKEHKKAWAKLKLCKELLGEEKYKDDEVFRNLIEALNHTLLSTEAHLLFQTDKKVQAKEVVTSLQPVREMSLHGLAALQGLRAQFFHHYRSEGVKLALQYARHALTLEPDSPLWLILTSQSIRRLRKCQQSMEEVTEEEVKLLERTVEIKRSTRHLILLAQTYREAGHCRFKKHRHEKHFYQSRTFCEITEMQAKAFKLYREALSLQPDSEVVNRLCGHGLLRLPEFQSDYRLAERCLLKALEQDPLNPVTTHSLGLYYYKGVMDYEKAALFCEKAGKLGFLPASLDMLKMKCLVYGKNYDPVFDFQKLLNQYSDNQEKRHEILCQMGSYYLLFERNLCKALKYFKTLIEEKSNPAIMTSHKPTFLNINYKINLFQYIVNSGLELLQGKEVNKDLEQNSKEDVEAFLNDLKVMNPELFQITIHVNMIDDLHKTSDDIKQTYIRKKERRDSAKGRRRSSLTDRRSSLDCNISATTSRRQSESNLNMRRRSSGNIESYQSKSYRNFNNLNQRHQGEYLQQLNGLGLDSKNQLLRRRSLTTTAESGQSCSFTKFCQKKNNYCFNDSKNTDTTTGTSLETDKPLNRLKSYEYDKSERKRNENPGYKRFVSWNLNVQQETQTNWRVKN